jgi:hypothetical protein
MKSLQQYNMKTNSTPRNRLTYQLTQHEYVDNVNKLNIILNSMKDEPIEPITNHAVLIEPITNQEIIEPEIEPVKTPRKRRTKKEIELDLENITQKQKEYLPPKPIPPSKPTRPKPPLKIISSTIAIKK